MPPKRANPIDYPPPASSSEVDDDTTSGSSVDEDASSSDEEQTPAPSPLPKTQTLTPKSAAVKPQPSTTKTPTTEESGSDSDSESEDDSKLGSGSEEDDDDSDSDEEEEEPLPVTTPPPKKAATSKNTKSSKEADETPTPTPVASKNVAENGEKPEDGKKFFQRVWSDTDEVAVLEGIIEYKALKGSDPVADINAFRDFIKSRLHFDVSLSQLRDKISRLKKKFKDQYQKDENKTYPGEQNQKLFDLSKVIWAAGAGASNGNVEKSNAKAEKSTEKAETSHGKAEKSTEKAETSHGKAEKSTEMAEKSPAKSNGKAAKAEKSKSESGRKRAEDVTTDEDEDVVMEDNNGVMKMGTDMDRSPGSNKRMKFDFYDFSIGGESMEDFVRKGLQFVDEEKRPVIEAKWKKLQVEELKLAAKKHALLKEQTELMVASLED